ncbi:MAG: hypothetical protein D6747_08080 [Chlorobiota bacterium]|jgi:hypothetical protein|nr:MAG: hypothetical protein D6747_08080 [Chlorobiota bacterium]
MKRFLSAFAVLIAATIAAHAQSAPNGQFGIGLALGSSGSGAQFTYAVNPNIHVGGRLGFASFSQNDSSQSAFAFAPFFRYLFNASAGVMPYLHAEFEYSSISVSGVSRTSTALFLGGGVAYYWNATFGVRGEIFLLGLGLDPSYTQFSIAPARIGVDWFFGR